MEIKSQKTRKKIIKNTRISKPSEIVEEVEVVTPNVIEKETEEIISDGNNNYFVEKEEAIVIENDNENNLLDLAKQTNKKPEKIYFLNVVKENKKHIFNSLPWILLIVLLIALFYLWFQLSDMKKDPIKAAQAETTAIVGEISQIMVLPAGESPKIATLTADDINKVKTQAFFTNAKEGDKLLVYSVARKVILYNPDEKKIVEVANLDATTGNQPGPSTR